MANLDHERKLLQDQVMALKREIDVKESYFDIERKRANEIENVLVYEREGQMRNISEI